ncbi:MAG: hypothetical protein ACLGXA_07990 [Acidobacteriota bacterium]
MKTMTEALACLKPKPGEHEAVVSICLSDDAAPKAEYHSGDASASVVSLVDIALEAGANPEIADLAACVVREHLDAHGLRCDAQSWQIIISTFLTGFAYGVRVGMEMEKAEL